MNKTWLDADYPIYAPLLLSPLQEINLLKLKSRTPGCPLSMRSTQKRVAEQGQFQNTRDPDEL